MNTHLSCYFNTLSNKIYFAIQEEAYFSLYYNAYDRIIGSLQL